MSNQNQQTIIPSYNNVMPSHDNSSNNNVSDFQKYKLLEGQERSSWSISRRCITIIVSMVVIAIIGCGLVWWKINSETESAYVQLVSLQVLPPGLKITNTSIIGTWQVNITVGNPNDDEYMNFIAAGRVTISYQKNLLASTPFDNFLLNAHKSTSLIYNLTTSPDLVLDKWILSEADHDKSKDGILKFALQINLRYYVMSTDDGEKENLRMYCNDLNVQLGHKPEDKGELIKTDNMDCIKDIV